MPIFGPPICASGWLYGVHCISHRSYCQTLYLGRGGPQDQDAHVRHAHWVCRYRSLNRQLPQLDDFSCLEMRFTHRTAFAVSPTNLIAGRSTREGEGHQTKTHAYVTRAGCVGPVHKNDRYPDWTIFRVTVFLQM